MAKMRRRYQSAGREYNSKLIGEVGVMFQYHRKAAIRALNAKPRFGVPSVHTCQSFTNLDKVNLIARVARLGWLQRGKSGFVKQSV